MPYYVMFTVEREDIFSRNMASLFADYSWWVDLKVALDRIPYVCIILSNTRRI